MATEKGVVIRTEGNYASVKTSRTAGCEGCSSHDFCGNRNGGLEMETEAVNEVGAGVGDVVVIKCSSTVIIKVLFLVFIVPVLALVVGVVVGQNLSIRLSLDPTISSIVLGLISFSGSMLVVRWFDCRIAGKERNKTKIIQVLSRCHVDTQDSSAHFSNNSNIKFLCSSKIVD